MGSLLTIYAFDELWNLVNIIKYGFQAIQHRGSQFYILCTAKDGIKCYEDETPEVSRYALDHVAIAATYSEKNGEKWCISDGNGVGIAVIVDRAWKKLPEFASDLVKGIREGKNLEKVFKSVLANFVFDESDPIPSIQIITNSREVIVWRTSYGLTPLILGSYGFDMAIVSSESTAVDILGGDIKRFIEAGEGIHISRHLAKTFSTSTSKKCSMCLFELLYIARHDAIVDGISVYMFRKMLGEKLAEHLDNDIDVVVGVPETALPYAIGFSHKIRKPFELAFVATGGRRRSMLLSDPFEKIVAIHLKMNPIKSVLEGKKVALVDDSMVTGATMKTVAQILRFRIGVKELHIFVASPPLTSKCPFDIVNLDTKTLLAANLSTDLAKGYLEADSLHWLSREDVNNVAKKFHLKLCSKCFGIDFLGD
jgi:amidophosphoribosyltransferase